MICATLASSAHSESRNRKARSREHIVPDFLLHRMDIKKETISGDSEREYAKVKVPAHADCNSRFASAYENKVKFYLDDLDSLFDDLIIEDGRIILDYGPDDSAASIISTWLSKIYYGLFYYDLVTSGNPEWRDVCASVVASQNFELVRRSYQQGHGFGLASTLYAFRSKYAQGFDLRTTAAPAAILFKVDSLVLVLAIADGFLTKQYLRGEDCHRPDCEPISRYKRTPTWTSRDTLWPGRKFSRFVCASPSRRSSFFPTTESST